MLPNSAQFGDWCAAPFPLGSEGHAHENRSYIHLVGIASENFDQLVQIVPTSAVRRDWSEFDVDRPVPCRCLPLLHLSTSASMKYV